MHDRGCWQAEQKANAFPDVMAMQVEEEKERGRQKQQSLAEEKKAAEARLAEQTEHAARLEQQLDDLKLRLRSASLPARLAGWLARGAL
eukprot:2783730-Rhodomonas_salina.1